MIMNISRSVIASLSGYSEKTASSAKINNVRRNIENLNRTPRLKILFPCLFFGLIIALLLSAPLPGWATGTYTVQLSPEEKAWLGNNYTVRVRVGDAPPWEIDTPNPQGMSVDYLTLIGNQFGINFKFIQAKEIWIDGFNDIAGEHLKYDLLPAVKRTEERLKILAMSDSYLDSPWVIFRRKEAINIYGIEDLRGKKVSVEQGYAMQKILEKNYSKIELIIRESTEDALLALSTGEVDAYIGNLIVTSYMLQSHGITNIKVGSPTPFGSHSQAIVTRKEWAPLISIINKGLKNIPQKEKTRIQNIYSSVRFEYGLRTRDIVKWVVGVAFVFLVILAIIGYWNRRLNREILERLKVEEALSEAKIEAETLAGIDPLTEVCNRRSFFEHGEFIHKEAQRYGRAYAIIMLDIDWFKKINDSYGHKVGDDTLKALTATILKVVRKSDVTARIGGEEFAIIVPESSLDKVFELAERIRRSIMDISILGHNRKITITASFGIAEYVDTDFITVLEHADHALYEAKNQGKNKVVRFKP